jgi:hypothetical protein
MAIDCYADERSHLANALLREALGGPGSTRLACCFWDLAVGGRRVDPFDKSLGTRDAAQ